MLSPNISRDIFYIIGKHLSVRDLLNLKQLNKKFRAIASNDYIFQCMFEYQLPYLVYTKPKHTRCLDWYKILYQNQVFEMTDEEVLSFATFEGHYNLVVYLVEMGTSVHIDNDWLLYCSVLNNHYHVTAYLMSKDAQIHIDNEHVLRWAANDGEYDIVVACVERGADVHAKEDEALKRAVNNGHRRIVEYLNKNS